MSEKLREAQKKRLEALVATTGRDLTTLARGAKLTPSTLTRFMNSPDAKHVLSALTLDKLERAYGAPTQDAPEVAGIPLHVKIAIIRAVAKALEVETGLPTLTERQREWLAAIERLPPAAEDQALNMVRVVAQAGIAANQQSSPGESHRGRRRS